MLLTSKPPFMLIEFQMDKDEKAVVGFDVTSNPPLENDGLVAVLEFVLKSIKADEDDSV